MERAEARRRVAARMAGLEYDGESGGTDLTALKNLLRGTPFYDDILSHKVLVWEKT